MQISNENFPSVWNYLDNKRRWAKKLYVCRRVAEPAAQLVYFVLFFGFSFSCFLEYGGKLITDFLGKYPQAMHFWNESCAQYFPPISLSWESGLKLIADLTLISLAAAVPFVLLVILLYHPRRKEIPMQESLYRDGVTICYREFARYSGAFRAHTRNFCCVFFGVSAFAFAVGFSMHCARMREYHAFMEEYASKINLAANAGALGLIAAYVILNLPLNWALRYGLQNRISKSFRENLDSFLNSENR